MEIVFKYARQKIRELEEAEPTLQAIFNIIHDQGDRIFAEYIDMFEVKTVSYKQIKEYIYKMASWLSQRINLPKNSFVALYMENSVNWIAVFWALLMIGYKPLLLNCRLPNEMNNQILKTMKTKLVITNQSNLKLNANISQLPSDEIIHNLSPLSKETWANQMAICTTASSLSYKICVYSGANMRHQLLNSDDVIGRCPRIKKHYKHRLKLLAILPFYHIFGFVATYMWFAAFGRTIVFLNNYSADTILYTVRRCEVTHIFAVPLFWNTIAQTISKQVARLSDKQQRKFKKGQKFGMLIQNIFPNFGIKIARKIFKEIIISTLGDSIQCLITGGGYIPKLTLDLLNSIGYPLYNGYGATEIGIICVEVRNKPKYRVQGSVGKPLTSARTTIKNNKIVVAGKSTCDYCISKDGKKQILNGKPFNTNDIGYLDKHNNLFINGRNDDVIIGENGEKINPDIIERELTFKYVNNYAIVEIKKHVSLVVQFPKNTNILLLQKIYNEIQGNINYLKSLGHNIETIYFTHDSLAPKQAIKVSRKIFKKLLDQNKITLYKYNELSKMVRKTKKEQNDNITLTIKKIFAQVLNKNLKDISNDQHFFLDLGGSSIDYCTCATRIQDEFNITLAFENTKCTSINDFAKCIKKERREHE